MVIFYVCGCVMLGHLVTWTRWLPVHQTLWFTTHCLMDQFDVAVSLVLASCAFQTSTQSADSAFSVRCLNFLVLCPVLCQLSAPLAMQQILGSNIFSTYSLYLFSFSEFYRSPKFGFVGFIAKANCPALVGQWEGCH